MNIAIVTPMIASDPDITYYASQHLNIAAELVREGDQVEIFTLNRQENGYREEEIHHKRIPIPVRFLPSVSTILERANLAVMQGLTEQLKSKRWDIIQSSEDIQPSTLQAAAAKGGGRLAIFQGINHYSFNTIKQLPMRTFDITAGAWLRSYTDLVIAKTAQAERFMRSKGYPQVVTIPMGVDLDLFHPHSREEGRKYLQDRGAFLDELTVLYIGNLIPRRDVATVLRGVKAARDHGVRLALVIIGKGPEEERLRLLTKELGLKKVVSYLKSIPNAELAYVYSGVNALVFAPLHEIFGMVLLEAMACGLPVISTPIPAVIDMIEGQTEHGLDVFPFGDHLTLGDCLLALAHDLSRRQQMEEQNRRIAEEHSWSVIASRIRNAYQNVMQ